MEAEKGLFWLRITHLENGSFVASVISDPTKPQNESSVHHGDYDDTGAVYYVIAVLFIYGFSIILMIGSSIKKSKHDGGVNKYMKDMAKVQRAERRQEKFNTRLVMHRKKYHHASLGADLAGVSKDGGCLGALSEIAVTMEGPPIDTCQGFVQQNVHAESSPHTKQHITV